MQLRRQPYQWKLWHERHHQELRLRLLQMGQGLPRQRWVLRIRGRLCCLRQLPGSCRP